MKLRKNILALGLMLLLLAATTSAMAALTPADFNLFGSGSAISFDGATLSMTIPMYGAKDPVTGKPTISAEGSLTLTATGIVGPVTANRIDFSGGTFQLTGTFNGVGNSSTPLVAGNLGANFIQSIPVGPSFYYEFAAGSLMANYINANVASFYWGSTPLYSKGIGAFNVGMTATTPVNFTQSPFSLSNLSTGSGDLVVNPVPIPGSFLLLGPGLAGLAIVRKRIFG